MKSNKNISFLFSSVGVLIMVVVVAAVCMIANVVKVRLDFTEDKLFTLSQGTKDILQSLDTPVELRFYCSQGGSDAAQLFVKNYSRNVDDLLKEYSKAAKGKLRVKRYNPEPDSDAEDMARADGVEGQMINTGDSIYMGVAVSCLDSTVALPFLAPVRERLLEYDITRAIARVSNPEKVKIGILTDLPMFGMPMNPMMMQQQQASQPWTVVSELKRDFDVVELHSDVEEIDENINTLLVVHPKNLPDQALYALDQFVLRGGHLIAFVDPLFRLDPAAMSQQNPMARMDVASNMEKLFTAGGMSFDSTRVVADKNYPTMLSGQGGQAAEFLTVLSLTSSAFDEKNISTAQVDNMLLAFPGCFSGTPASGLTKEVLIKSSNNSQLVDKLMAERNALISRDFQPSNKEYEMAIMLLGKFKTAFPEGAPKKAATENDSEKDSEKDSATASTETKPALKESAQDGSVVLVGDVDMLHDNFSVRVSSIFGQRFVQPLNGNLTLAQNLVEQMAGSSSLINMRSRATLNRPFTVIQEYRSKAEAQYQSQLLELENKLNEARNKISELQQAKSEGSQKFILSDEQRAELSEYRKSEAEAAKRLKEVRKNLRKDITSLENNLTWINTAGMAFVVVLVGIVIAIIKRKRTAAK